ncbi:FAD-binding oxidoreductase [Mesorhizobium sp.]|uniref:NAD(P)/FAD-dependent oxidoreductase n=1 Tax=Mesorhizobium sp. TaxID=1871066 RepID=UPI0011F505E3|nr:FAD-binding oxidoreductase [Mesorhizobium sp.]TIS33932.1 MAG: FAD-binding oxidoreductase [Mesorhizobium sp.]
MPKVKQLPGNDSTCGWLSQLIERTTRPTLNGMQKADWVVVGGGYTGMAAARQLATLKPRERIILLEANRVGEGASSRNSGFLVDATLNEGTGTASDIEVFRQKYKLALAAITEVKSLVDTYGIDCDWDPCGKLYGARNARYLDRLENFARLLDELGVANEILTGKRLGNHIGTDFYTTAVWTKTSVILQPAKLARGFSDNLPPSIEAFENTPVIAWQSGNGGYRLKTPSGEVVARNVIMAVNGFMPEVGIRQDRSFALQLTASMSRPLTDDEYAAIGAPKPYGLLSADAMGATIRLTRDRRILVRNTCEVPRRMSLDPTALIRRKIDHARALTERFPALSPQIFTHSWSGIVCLSANGHHVFGRIADGLFVAGCYNANGVGLANLLGREVANLAARQDSEWIPLIEQRSRPQRLPPQPLLGWGARLRLARDRLLARGES